MIAKRLLLAALLALPLGATPPVLAQPQPAAGARQPLLVPGKRSVFQRVLLRPSAEIHSAPGAANPRPGLGFSAFMVYARQGSGAQEWLEIGPGGNAPVEGWVKAEQTLEWTHAMVASFTNPTGRGLSLFLQQEAQARALLAEGGAAEATRLRAEAAAGRPSGGVVALEPANFVDITQQFYLLPILKAVPVERELGGPVRVLEVASAPAETPPPQQPPQADALANFRAGMVFVVDTTISMQPYIDRTREAMTGIIARLRDTPLRDKFRFGVVGFRDSKDATPNGYEYASKIFATPDFSQPAEAALQAMQGLVASTGGNEGFVEDPAAGLNDAINQIDWSALGGRYIVLITDASAREASDPLSSTRQGMEELRIMARERGVTMFVVHLLTPEGRAAGDHARARRNYATLAETPAGPLYYGVDDGGQQQFRGTISALVEGVLQQVASATGAPIDRLRGAGGGANLEPRQAQRMERQMRFVGEAMRLAYLGREERAQAPEVLRSFVLDRDPAPPGNTALNVRVLLTRNQLNDLTRSLEEILRAGRASRTSQNLFEQLQSAMATAARDPTRIAASGALGGLLAEFLEGLPYNSEIMGMTQQQWDMMSAGPQARILNQIEAKLRLYQSFSANQALWTTLSGRRDAGDQVFPVPLDSLP